MEYLVFIVVAAALILVVCAREIYLEKQKVKAFALDLRENYGKLREREYKAERFQRMDSYYRKHPAEGQVDDITWNDLGMDEIFKRLNHTYSAAGEEYLYYALRNAGVSKEKLEHFETLIQYFTQNEECRITFQLQMAKLGYTGKYSLYDYLDYLEDLGERNNTKSIICDLLFLPCFALMPFQLPLALCGVAALLIYNILSYFKEKAEIEPYIISFIYILRLMEVAKKLEALEKMPGAAMIEAEIETIRQNRKILSSMERGTYWLLAGGGVMGGNPLEMFTDYLRMSLHLDLIQFNKMLRILRQHTDAVDCMITKLGELETACAIGAVRQGSEAGFCVPQFTEESELKLVEGYHPLLTSPVKNSVETKKGILITGSNASGKSTFLKMVAINSILAQTVHTCFADEYCAPLFRIYSSMALRDDIGSGDSYYIVEIKALKRILDGAKCEGRPILCFVDEVLRGTNTIERISASTEILKSLRKQHIICFAATHDIELTQLLAEEYENYHFEEIIREGDISFPYRLLEGKSKTRNAIKLLELLGYDGDIIRHAEELAEKFEAGKKIYPGV